MNGKKAKKLRRKAGVTTEWGDGMDSKAHKKERAKITTHKRGESFNYDPGVTLKLNSASWVYYKQLKKESLTSGATSKLGK